MHTGPVCDPTTVTTLVSTDTADDSAAWKARATPNSSDRRERYKTIKTKPNALLLDLVTGLSSEQKVHLLDETRPLLGDCRENVSGYQGTKNLVTSRLIPQVFQK